jgi:hypothetical protein
VLIALALAVVAGVALGRIVGPRGGTTPAATRDVDVGAARLVVPGDWRTARLRSAGIPGLDPATTAVLSPYSGAPARAIVMMAPIDDPSLLPHALRAAAAGVVPQHGTTRLAGRPAWLYSDLLSAPGDRTMDITVMPTSAGVLAVACVAPITWSSAGGDCASMVQAVGVRGAGTLAPSADLALRVRLQRALTTLDAVRVRARAGLGRAATPAAQASWARELASANGAAAASLRPVAGAAGKPLLRRLSDTAHAYSRLALAATAGARNAFSSARHAVDRAEARLSQSVASLTAPRPVPASPKRAARAPAATGSSGSAGSSGASGSARSGGSTRWPEIVLLVLLLAAVLGGIGIRTLQGRRSSSWWEVRTADSRRRTPR